MIPPRQSLRVRLFLTQVLVILVGVGVLIAVMLLIGPTLHDRLMTAMLGTDGTFTHDPGMTAMERATNAVFVEAVVQALLLAAGAALFIAVVMSLVLSARMLQPIQRLLAASQRIAAGHYAERVPVTDADEFGALAAQFNAMAAELEAAERRRVALIGDVAHELRTPLATMAGYTEGLLDGVVEPSPATWAVLHDEVGRLRRLVQELQDLSRAEAHQLPLHPAPVAPTVLIEQTLARIAPQFAEKQVHLTGDVAPHLPAVQADADRILQVLMNLLGNALAATAAGGSVRVCARRAAHDDTHDASMNHRNPLAYVTFRVTDTGVGIAPEHLPHLFERFYRVDKARGRALGGSGIGLTISKALVEAHGGRIWVTSPGPNHGATVAFMLPVADRT